MKKMEFMRGAAKVLFDFFSELYLENDYTSQTIALKKQQASFKLRNQGGVLCFYLYMTGTISFNTVSAFRTKTPYREYYVYDANDDHEDVLRKFGEDLRKLKEYYPYLFMFASDEDDPFVFTQFQYDLPFSASLRTCYGINDDEDEEEEDEND